MFTLSFLGINLGHHEDVEEYMALLMFLAALSLEGTKEGTNIWDRSLCKGSVSCDLHES